MKKYICTVCDWVYDPDKGDPDSGILPGTPFEDIPYDWVCPLCGVGKDDFEEVISRRWKNKNKTLWCLSQNTEAFFLKAEMFRLPAFNFFVNSRKKCIFDARFPLFCIYGVER